MISPIHGALPVTEYTPLLSGEDIFSADPEDTSKEYEGLQSAANGDNVSLSKAAKSFFEFIPRGLFKKTDAVSDRSKEIDELYGKKILELRSIGSLQHAYSHMMDTDRLLNFFALPVTGKPKFDVERYARGPLSDIAPYNRDFNIIFTFSRNKTWHAEVRDPQYTESLEESSQLGAQEIKFIAKIMGTFFPEPFEKKKCLEQPDKANSFQNILT